MTQGSTRTLRFKDAVTLTGADGHETSYKAGENIALGNDPVQVEAPGQVSLLVVPVPSVPGTTDVKMRRMDSWSGPDMNREVNQRLNKVLARVIEAQRALARRSGQEALTILEDLQTTSPELSYLNFLRASAYVLMGDREKARTAVSAGLAAFPDDASGQALLKSLGSGR